MNNKDYLKDLKYPDTKYLESEFIKKEIDRVKNKNQQ